MKTKEEKLTEIIAMALKADTFRKSKEINAELAIIKAEGIALRKVERTEMRETLLEAKERVSNKRIDGFIELAKVKAEADIELFKLKMQAKIDLAEMKLKHITQLKARTQ